jgi:hypothetical protein
VITRFLPLALAPYTTIELKAVGEPSPSPRSGEGGPKGRIGCGKQVWIDAGSR